MLRSGAAAAEHRAAGGGVGGGSGMQRRLVLPLLLPAARAARAMAAAQRRWPSGVACGAAAGGKDSGSTTTTTTSSSSITRPATPPAAVVAAAAAAKAEPASSTTSAPPPLPARLVSYLAELNDEQRAAVFCPDAHVSVVAGPGSGKTRVVAARVAHLVGARGVRPEQVLAITFTRKAAGELAERLNALLEPGVARRVRTCTFHRLCHDLLRTYGHLTPVGRDFSIADEQDAREQVQALLEADLLPAIGSGSNGGASAAPTSARGGGRSGGGKKGSGSSSSSSSSSSSKVTADEVRVWRSRISRLKNFCEATLLVSTSGGSGGGAASLPRPRGGAELLQEAAQAGAGGLAQLPPKERARLAALYDRYVAATAAQRLLDFDDLLHHALALLRGRPEVAAALRRRYRHVLVDEVQDTNLAQHALVRALVEPHATSLFVVGDADQSIYGFRGAASHLLSSGHGGGGSTGAGAPTTRVLACNYRSRAPIVALAEHVRSGGRAVTAAARALRASSSTGMGGPGGGGDVVALAPARNEYAEADAVVAALLEWRRRGYPFGRMAVLARTKERLRVAYLQALKEGVPARVVGGKDLFDSAEARVALALVRLVAAPRAAGEAVRRRVVANSLRLPLTAGLGADALTKLVAFLAEQEQEQRQQQRQQPNAVEAAADLEGGRRRAAEAQARLSACLFDGCCEEGQAAAADDADAAAREVLERWQRAGGGSQGGGSSSAQQDARLEALRALAPPWQRPEGFAGLNTKRQQAAVAQLRGLAVLGRAAARLHAPAQVLELLLDASGLRPELRAVANGEVKPAAKLTAKDVQRRLRNLDVLVRVASGPAAAELGGAPAEEEGDDDDEGEGGDEGGGGASGSGSDSGAAAAAAAAAPPRRGLAALRAFLHHCLLQGDDEDEEEEDAAEPGGGGEEEGRRVRDRVQLMTAHASKGKEFDCVAVVGAHDGAFPHYGKAGEGRADEQQERNTLFVAITRARDHLLVSWPLADFRSGAERSVSPFLEKAVGAARRGEMRGVVVRKTQW